MSRSRICVGAVFTILVILGDQSVHSDPVPVGEVRSSSYVQSRPVFHKPSLKPKLALKLPSQLLLKSSTSSSSSEESKQAADSEKITQTVYGFLDFVTTIGNTVMVFTPQTKNVEALHLEVRPTSAAASAIPEVKATEIAEATNVVITKSKPARQPKLMVLSEPSVQVEASEVEPALTAPSSVGNQQSSSEEQDDDNYSGPIEATPVVPQETEIRTQVNVVASSPNLGSGEFIEGDFDGSSEPEEEEETEQLIPSSSTTTTTTPKPLSKHNKNGFTLKLTPKHNAPVIVTPTLVQPIVVTAQKVDPPASVSVETPKPKEKVTKVSGTHVVESTVSVVKKTKIEASKGISFPSLVKPSILFAQKAPTTTTTTNKPSTSSSTTSSSVDENDFENDEGEADENNAAEDETDQEQTKATPIIEPTPTASEEQTHYVLPVKPEKIYISAVPSPNAYSRQPQLYVDINPAKPDVAVVTATPSSRGKQFRLTNRFAGRNSKHSGSHSNELTYPHETAQTQEPEPAPTTSSRSSSGRSRFGRNRGRGKIEETTAVSTVVVSATPTRRFKGGRGSSTPAPTRTKEFGSFKTGRGFSPGRQQQQVQVVPTTSTSIYRFKLNRPTGRWRFKPSPKPKVNIIKTKEDEEELENGGEEDGNKEVQVQAPTNGQIYQYAEPAELHTGEESRTESNELIGNGSEPEPAQQTLRVATVTPTEFEGLDKFLEIATIKSPYVFQAGNVKNTRYITVTKTFTREPIQPTLASSVQEATLENILATKAPYDRILEGSSDVATLPVINLGTETATPPLETVTQTFSTTQLMLKTSILPVLYDGVTTLYTLTQSYFVTRMVTAHKTVPPVELFQFVPTKSLHEFNTALQEAGSEHREHLLGSESDDDSDTNYAQILAPFDDLSFVGSDFDPSFMDDKVPKRSKSTKLEEKKEPPRPKESSNNNFSLPPNPFSIPSPNSIQDPLASITGLTPEQLALIRYFSAQNQQQQAAASTPQIPQIPQMIPQSVPGIPQFQQQPPQPYPGQLGVTSSPIVVDTTATVTETKTLRLLFGSKPTSTVLYSTRVIPTKMTTYITASLPVKPTQIAPNPFLNPLSFPLAYVG